MSKPIDHVATLVAEREGALDAAALPQLLEAAGVAHARCDWLAANTAVDVFVSAAAAERAQLRARLEGAAAPHRIDVIVQPVNGRRKMLLVADMDSTMIEEECIDELAALVGLRAHVAAITARAMAGELVFEEALAARVKLLAGVPLAQINALATQMTPTRGARVLVQTMRANGAYTALVSGGFTLFTQPIAARLGFDETRANRLELAGEGLSGVVTPPIQGRAAKRAALEALRAAHSLSPGATLAIGDGANDLDMLAEAGLGIAFHAKPKVAEAAQARIDFADLTAVLYAQGYRRNEFVD